MAKGNGKSDKVRDELMKSPHLFSARHNRDFETMARFANEELGADLSAKDVAAMMDEAPEEPAPKPQATKRARH